MLERDSFKRWYLLPLAALAWNELVFYGGRLLARGLPHIDMTTPLDEAIPFVPWTVAIYFGCFIFWAVSYIVCAKQERAEAARFYLADFIVKAVCLVFFVALPTQMSRPDVRGSGFWNDAMRFLYRIDEPNNLFPSIHCAVSWLAWAGVRGRKELPLLFRLTMLLTAVAVVAATLTTKQHLIPDAVSGIALAELSWLASGYLVSLKRSAPRSRQND